MTPADSLARLRLARTEGIGPQNFRRLLARYGTAAATLRALRTEGAGRLAPPAPEAAEREHDAVLALGGAWLHLGTAPYPPLLAQLEDAPPVLAALGNLSSSPAGRSRWPARGTPPRAGGGSPRTWRRRSRRRG